MTDAPAPIGPPAIAALKLFIQAAQQVPDDSWDKPSNLDEWSVRELVAHATGSATKIITLIEGGEVWAGPSAPADFTADDPMARLHELDARLAEALPGADLDAPRVTPQGEVPLRRVLALPVCDLAIHSWDLHRSLGGSLELPYALLVFCRRLVDSVPEDALRRPGGFGPAQPVPDGASPTVTLMAFLGRAVGPA
ncbi:TIGR03086 family protein [Mycobacterium sp. M1]|uniref:TIGR03086 family protein n=1 Tax=Mycolicibacter acidiphilus TaxID=2835306 RepID=A0ABS5RJN0_9MYCO|nr:TIGR03086 family metal-binding protein [Mycolicibacter acidiphilus]MBS9534493.1 TIGR03086 family protein [Mycolicibacter acidiphilus]